MWSFSIRCLFELPIFFLFFIILSSYLLWNLSSLVSPPSIYISCGRIMKSPSFQVEESMNSRSASLTVRQNRISMSEIEFPQWKPNCSIFSLLLRCSYAVFCHFFTLLMNLYWKAIMNGISYHSQFLFRENAFI